MKTLFNLDLDINDNIGKQSFDSSFFDDIDKDDYQVKLYDAQMFLTGKTNKLTYCIGSLDDN